MRKFILFVGLFLMPIFVNAASKCSYERQVELESKANLIKTNYEEKEDILSKDEYFYPDTIAPDEQADFVVKYNYFIINVLNISKDYYVEITNNVNDEKVIINYSDTQNSNYAYKWENLAQVTTFTFSIFTSNETECADEKVKITYLTTPRYNEFYARDICLNHQNESICQKYVTFNEISESSFNSKIENLEKGTQEKEKKEETKSWYDNVTNFIAKNRGWFIAGGILVVAGVGTIIVIQRKRSRI